MENDIMSSKKELNSQLLSIHIHKLECNVVITIATRKKNRFENDPKPDY